MSATTVQRPTRTTPPRWQADLALATVALVWGSTFVVVKHALLDISTLYFLALRFSVASLCMLLLFLPAFRRAGWPSVRQGLRGGAVAGLLLWLGYLLQTFGLKYTTAANSGFLTGLYIVLVPLTSAAIYRRWPQWRELLGIAIATVGMTLLTVPSVRTGLQLNFGDLLTIGCVAAFACHLLVLGYFSQRERFEAVALGVASFALGTDTAGSPSKNPSSTGTPASSSPSFSQPSSPPPWPSRSRPGDNNSPRPPAPL